MLLAKENRSGYGPMFERTVFTKPGIKAEFTTGHIHSRPIPQSAYKLLKLFGGWVGPGRPKSFGGQNNPGQGAQHGNHCAHNEGRLEAEHELSDSPIHDCHITVPKNR